MSTLVSWIRDIYAENVLRELDLRYELEDVSTLQIDKKTSQRNAARLSAKIDSEHVDSIVSGIQRGDQIPFLVVRKLFENGKQRFVIAGGNHRFEALIQVGESFVKTYSVVCGDTEFLVLCQKLNLSNGKGVSEHDRVLYAASALEKGLVKTTQEAENLFRVKSWKIRDYLKLQKAEQVLAARTGKTLKLPQRVKIALAKIQADAVHQEALNVVSNSKLASHELSAIINEVLKKPTEGEQIEFLKNVKRQSSERKVASPNRAVFLKSLTTLERLLQQHKSFLSLDIVDDASSIRSRIEVIAKALSSL